MKKLRSITKISIITTLFALTLSHCSSQSANGESNDPKSKLGSDSDTELGLVIDTSNTNGVLSCSDTLSLDDQLKIVNSIVQNHGIELEVGEKLSFSNVALDYEIDEDGWKLQRCEATVTRTNIEPDKQSVINAHRANIASIMQSDTYCGLPTPTCLYELCGTMSCPPGSCNHRIVTGGVIIAVVSGIFGGGDQ